MERFDSTKTGNFTTKLKEELAYQVNWDKVKTFEDFLLLLKHGIISSITMRDGDLNNKDKDIKKFFKTDGSKILVVDEKSD